MLLDLQRPLGGKDSYYKFFKKDYYYSASKTPLYTASIVLSLARHKLFYFNCLYWALMEQSTLVLYMLKWKFHVYEMTVST